MKKAVDDSRLRLVGKLVEAGVWLKSITQVGKSEKVSWQGHEPRARVPQKSTEPPRDCRRLFLLRGWRYDKDRTVLPRSAGAGGTDGVRARAGAQLPVGNDRLDCRFGAVGLT